MVLGFVLNEVCIWLHVISIARVGFRIPRIYIKNQVGEGLLLEHDNSGNGLHKPCNPHCCSTLDATHQKSVCQLRSKREWAI